MRGVHGDGFSVQADLVTIAAFSSILRDLAELKAAGFEARDYQGFPLMKMPAAHAQIKFRPSVAADRRVYAEGCCSSRLLVGDLPDFVGVSEVSVLKRGGHFFPVVLSDSQRTCLRIPAYNCIANLANDRTRSFRR
jgi:hypothetical protein